MNRIFIKGRLTRDPESRQTQSGIDRTTFSVAVDREVKNKDGNRETDFFNCVAWHHTAKFVQNYFSKGQEIICIGSMQNRSYEAQDGSKRTVSELIVESVEFCGKRGEAQEKPAEPDKSAWIEEDDMADGLPF